MILEILSNLNREGSLMRILIKSNLAPVFLKIFVENSEAILEVIACSVFVLDCPSGIAGEVFLIMNVNWSSGLPGFMDFLDSINGPNEFGSVVFALLAGTSKCSARGSIRLKKLVYIFNDKVIVWSLVFQLLLEDQILLVKDLKDLKFFYFPLVNVKRVMKIISLVVFGIDKAGYWLLEVIVGVMALHWKIIGIVLSSMMDMGEIFSLHDCL
ncbi:hypothetical protein KFK09_007363 [Dendrobium nobile]|uniref:Uncharacterized protein n=1 Tax=Dendrobium nobile TaxID=94219 RepID=A0A8T3BRN4_DENNO|nr:hypothetical protein KFK09_007363 [Dendrobium nobile]